MSEHNLILEFYKPTYNLDFDYNGDGGLDLHFTNIKGEFFMTMNDSYDSVYIEDEDCEFSKGEMFATVDLGDLVERIINGEFRQTNGKAVSDWGKRFIGDGEEQIEFNGKNYADGASFWDDFFKEMSKDEIKDFMIFCEDYLYLPNIEVDTVSNKWDFENGKVELKSNDKWGIGISDDYNIISVDEFTCDSTDAFVAYDVASSESDEDDFYESKKSARKSLKENELFSSNTPYEIKVNGKKIKSHSDYEVVYDRVENDEYVLGIKIKGVGNTQLRFSSKNEAKELGWITESKKSARKSLKESIEDDVDKLNNLKNQINSYAIGRGKVPSSLMKQYKELIKKLGNLVIYSDNEDKWILNESKKSAKKSLKESFEYDGAIPLEELMDILDDEWKYSKNSGIFGNSSHWDDESRDEGKYIEISAIIDFNSASNWGFNNKRVQKLYDDECNKIYKEVDEDYDEYDEILNEYEPILFLVTIDLKEKIIYADVDLGNGLGDTEVAREKLAENENDFRKQVQRMIDSF